MARGDHLYVERAWGLYRHHGIDRGDGSVIHFHGPDPLRARVRRSSLEVFCAGEQIRIAPDVGRSNAASLQAIVAGWLDRRNGRAPREELDTSPDAIVARAESRLGEGDYDLVFNNCEHFATWCRTGVSHSAQTERLFVPLGELVPPPPDRLLPA